MCKNEAALKFRWFWLFVAYSLVAYVIYSSLTPTPIHVDVSFFDKYAHTFGYFVLMGRFMQLYHGIKNTSLCAVVLILMGVALEFIQDLTGYRFFDFYDMLANAAGVLLAWSLLKTPFPYILTYFETMLLSVQKS